MNRILVLLGALLCAPAWSASRDRDVEINWQALLFDGVKVGHALSERSVADGIVSTREVMVIEIRRSGEPVRMDAETTYRETVDGKPLGFQSTTRASAMEMRVEAQITDGIAEVSISNAGQLSQRSVPLGEALLGEGQRLKLVRSGLKAGQVIEFMMFEPGSLEAVAVQTRVIGKRRVEVYDRSMELIEVEQTIAYPGNPITARAWVDLNFKPYRSSLDLLGMKIEQVSCDRSCALKPNQPLDYLKRLLIEAPRAITAAEQASGLRYSLLRRDGAALELPDTGEQRARSKDEARRIELDVCSDCGPKAHGTAPPDALEATAWLQSDHAEIQALMREALAETPADASTARRMQALEDFVHAYIRTKDLSVGYASALETVRNRSGDCTEHALLLAALARAAGIPSRVVTGFAYIDQYAGSDQVFVPHAWTQAWVDGRWHSFDAALSGFDAGHIALGVGDGDPSRFYAGMNLLGELEVQAIEALP